MKSPSSLVISGANEGIGYHLASQALHMGMNVAILDIHTDQLSSLKAKYPQELVYYECDISLAEEVKKYAKIICEKFKNIDYVIHNACIAVFKSVEEACDEDYLRSYQVNFLGAVHLTQAFLPFFKAQNHGKFFFVSSGVGVMGFSNLSPYACSKGAIESLVKCMNLEYRNTNISFHLMHPPLTKTTSASALPVPAEFMANPQTVGSGLAKKLSKKRIILSHSFLQSIQTRFMYLFPTSLGRLMDKMTKNQKTNI